MKKISIYYLFFLLLFSAGSVIAQQKNVLLLMADDFNHWLAPIGYDTQAITPNISSLAADGVLFADTSSASPVCNPSRQALWSGLRPSTTGISRNGDGFVRDAPGFQNVVTMNQYFMQQGYYVYGGGKLYHPAKMGARETDPDNWSALYTGGTGSPGGSIYSWALPSINNFYWGAGEFDLSTADDTKLALHMADKITNYHISPQSNKPFFIACGFFRPHLPWLVEKQFFDLYNLNSLSIPQGYLNDDLDDIPGAVAATDHKEITAANKWKDAMRAYLAGLSYADYNVGIVLDALNASQYKSNTVIVFVGDHGWHLGEKDRWRKFAVYDNASRTTMVIYDPSASGNGGISRKVVSMLDIYPTLVELAGLPRNDANEGNSLRTLLDKPNDANWNKSIVLTYAGINVLKTSQWRFVDNGSQSQLYNIVSDPYEWFNLYSNPAYVNTVAALRTELANLISGNEPGGPPAAPTGLTATAQSGAVVLDWDDNAESNIEYYIVKRASNRGSSRWRTIATVTQSAYTDQRVRGGRTYRYVVQAENTQGQLSPESSQVSATP